MPRQNILQCELLIPPIPIYVHSDKIGSENSTTASAMFTAMTMSDFAIASQQLMALAAYDNRGFALLLPLVPALGWVLFNILQLGLNQFNKMHGIKAVAEGVGLGATLITMMLIPHASVAQEMATLAVDSDSRGLVLLGITSGQKRNPKTKFKMFLQSCNFDYFITFC
jgi:photosystem II PsbY protein